MRVVSADVMQRETTRIATFSRYATVEQRSESAPVRRYSVIAMQLGFLRAIAPIKILVGAEGWRAAQFFIVDVEFVGLEFRIVLEAPPRQRKQIGSDAEYPDETGDRVGNLAADLVDHQPLDVADPLATRPSHRGALDPVARDQLVRFHHDVGHHHPPFGLMNGTNAGAPAGFPRRKPRFGSRRDFAETAWRQVWELIRSAENDELLLPVELPLALYDVGDEAGREFCSDCKNCCRMSLAGR